MLQGLAHKGTIALLDLLSLTTRPTLVQLGSLWPTSTPPLQVTVSTAHLGLIVSSPQLVHFLVLLGIIPRQLEPLPVLRALLGTIVLLVALLRLYVPMATTPQLGALNAIYALEGTIAQVGRGLHVQLGTTALKEARPKLLVQWVFTVWRQQVRRLSVRQGR